MDYKPAIGLEIHVELLTKTKIFCGCKTQFGAQPNSQLCPVCLGLPGALPVLNEKVVELAVMTGLLLNSQINYSSGFDRKNYFYPDLVKGYQITQYYSPLAQGGYLDIDQEGTAKRIRINRVHMEEDAGKSIHLSGETLLDYNRSGVPLMEIVTEPDFQNGEEVVKFLYKLREKLVHANISDCKLEEGSLRVDVNISLASEGEPLGKKTEIKNINSFKNIEKAIICEIKRQKSLLKYGDEIREQTLGFNDKENSLIIMRDKEITNDYMYFPEYDLPQLQLEPDYIEIVRSNLPRDIDETKEELFQLGIPENQVDQILKSKKMLQYFYKVYANYKDAKKIVNLLFGDFAKLSNEKRISIEDIALPPQYIAELLTLTNQGKISNVAMKKVLKHMLDNQEQCPNPNDLIEKLNLEQTLGKDEIREIVFKVLRDNEVAVNDYQKGKEKAFKYLMGLIMRDTKGKADPQVVRSILKDNLDK